MLHGYGETPTETQIAHELGAASLLYTIGGNSPYMLKTMRQHGTDVAVAEAIRTGKVHAGVSAGALLPFELAHSCVAKKPAEEQWDYELLHGLNLISGVASAHANQFDPAPTGFRSETRHEALVSHFPQVQRGYTVDNGASMIFSRTDPALIFTDPSARARIIEPTGSSQPQSRDADVRDLLIL